MNDRLWYRLHWSTWLVLAIMVLAIVYRQGVWQLFVGEQPGTYIYKYGWPSIFCEVWDFQTSPDPLDSDYDIIAVLWDVIASLAVITSPAILLERAVRRTESKTQLELSTVFTFVASIAGTLALWRAIPNLFLVPVPYTFIPESPPEEWARWCSWLTRIALFAAVTCTIYAILQCGRLLLPKRS